MGDDSAAIKHALSELASLVATELAGQGWVRRTISDYDLLVLTKPVHDEVYASVEIGPVSFRMPQVWPETIRVRFGAGYEPALGLMPLVTLRARVALASEPHHGEAGTDLRFEVMGASHVRAQAAEIVAAVMRHGTSFAASYDVDGFDAELQDTTERPSALAMEMRPVLLASARRLDQAREALDGYLAEEPEATSGRHYQRFARQLRRWLDAGGPPIPPIEQTLQRMPPPPPGPERPSWSTVRRRSAETAEARDAVRDLARGKTVDEIAELLIAEYAARGLDMSASGAARTAEMIRLEQQPFGKVRGLVRGLKVLKGATSDAVGLIRQRVPPNPDWMQPPAHAAYRVGTSSPYIAITLHPDSGPVLARACEQATRRIGPGVLIDVWLDSPDGHLIRAHLGDHEIGVLTEKHATRFAADMAAATELFDEALRVRATLAPSTPDRGALVEIGTPKHA